MNLNKLKKQYLCSVSQNIKCCKKDKKEYLDFLSASIDNYLQENENTDYEKLCEIFGTPIALAAEYTESLTVAQVRKYKIIKAISAVLIIALIIVALFVLYWLVVNVFRKQEIIIVM